MTVKKVGGGKLSRSETVTVRLDPKLRYLAELAARKHRRTLSSYIEWAIEESLGKVVLADEGEQCKQTVLKESSTLWDVDEADRFAKLALNYPDLLTHEEQVLWKIILEVDRFWDGTQRSEKTLDFKYLRSLWGSVEKYLSGQIDAAQLEDLLTIPF